MKTELILAVVSVLFVIQVLTSDNSTNASTDDKQSEDRQQSDRFCLRPNEVPNPVNGNWTEVEEPNNNPVTNPYGFVQSALSQARWRLLSARMAKVILGFFMDLFIAHFFEYKSVIVKQVLSAM